jgi:DNA-binding PadR family transcriptional regulator
MGMRHHQQIYRELAQMEEQGWLSTETIHQEGRPDKKLYSVTELDKEQMRQWIGQPAEVSPVKEDILVKLHAGHLVAPEVLLV